MHLDLLSIPQSGGEKNVHVNSLNKKDPPTTLLLAVNVPLLLLYRKDDLLNISTRDTYVQRDKTRRCPPPPC